MNRLSYQAKFIWLGSLLLFAILFLVITLQGHLDEDVQNLSKEQVGITYVRQTTELIRHLQQHRGRSASVLGGNAAMNAARINKSNDVATALKVLADNLPENIGQHPEFRQIKNDWQRIQTDGMTWSVPANFQAHNALIDSAIGFLVTIGDSYHLVLDGDIGTHYLIDLAITKVPALTERMGKIRAYGSAIISVKTISSDQQYALATLLAELRAIHQQVQKNLLHTREVSPEQSQLLDATGAVFSQASSKVDEMAGLHILNRKFDIDPESYFGVTTQAIDKTFTELFEVLYPAIDHRLAARIDSARLEWRQTMFTVSALIILVTYLAIGGYLSVMNGVKEVLIAIKAFASGNTSRRTQLDSRDEIAQIGAGFNEMASSIQALIAEREADHGELEKRAEGLLLAGRVFEEAFEGISVTNTHGVILNVNPMFCKMTGFSREELVGKTYSMIKSAINDPAIYSKLWTELLETGHWQGELWNRKKDGREFAIQLTISALRNERDEVRNYVGLCSDITELKLQHDKMERLAHHDALTGLPNRSLLSDRLQQALIRGKRNNEIISVVGLDLDGFKAVNDTFGHEAGDTLLIEVARRLEQAVREGDTVARIGGDEFVMVLCKVSNIEDCERVLQRVLTTINRPVRISQEQTANVSGSLGYTLFPDDHVDADTLMRHADLAMYAAKQSGKNRFCRFDLKLDQRQRVNSYVLKRLEKGLANNEFALYVQPKLNLATGKAIGAEALLRWLHPKRGVVSPAEFLPIIEHDVALSIKFDNWVLSESLRVMSNWRQAGLQLPISINISAHQLLKQDFFNQLTDNLGMYPELSPSDLEIEIVESLALDEMQQVAELIRTCRTHGIRFALDDFGTGYSTLTYLKQLAVNTLKIDQSFVGDMESDLSSLAIVQGVIGLAAAFKCEVVAEGVESLAQAIRLKQLGCGVIQGYWVARPMPACDMVTWVENYIPSAEI